jgi:hypothetical protein
MFRDVDERVPLEGFRFGVGAVEQFLRVVEITELNREYRIISILH